MGRIFNSFFVTALAVDAKWNIPLFFEEASSVESSTKTPRLRSVLAVWSVARHYPSRRLVSRLVVVAALGMNESLQNEKASPFFFFLLRRLLLCVCDQVALVVWLAVRLGLA